MTKREVFLAILFPGLIVGVMLAELAGRPNIQNLENISAAMVLWGTISATITIALSSGPWNEKFSKQYPAIRKLPSWVWPALIIALATANYLTALAVVIGNAIFSPKDK